MIVPQLLRPFFDGNALFVFLFDICNIIFEEILRYFSDASLFNCPLPKRLKRWVFQSFIVGLVNVILVLVRL
ncbi:hypothetical protein CEXT_410591 [Caerostris extrusa]|uniref:Uncharacterized protein n=1 Tax=Caerostris extrusa TaxID=172846 RepID=A0AAV4RXV6_CAEEX|nr:hypothetical protein CEXT_410591 [Caerostris extrusa]